jgi:hypothetical protein
MGALLSAEADLERLFDFLLGRRRQLRRQPATALAALAGRQLA